MFAESWARDSEGLILFPKDMAEWKLWFKQKTKGHPAPMNLYMVQELVRYYTKPGDRLLDPMAGSGTLAWAITEGRDVVLIELMDEYNRAIEANLNHHNGLRSWHNYPGQVIHLEGDCRRYLPLPVNHIIFSPPYSNIRGQKSKLEEDIHVGTKSYKGAGSVLNIGQLAPFLYKTAMGKVYSLCFQSLPPGGTMSIIIQDFVKDGKIHYLSKDTIKVCAEAGFELLDWHKRFAPLTFFRRLTEEQNPDQPTINYEDILVFRRVT